jgi:DNA polymerase sigma
MSGDICVNQNIGLYNTKLLKEYVDQSAPYVKQLALAIKIWTKNRKIVGAKDGWPSSYAYTLMVIHFLQQKKILPNLQNNIEDLPPRYISTFDTRFHEMNSVVQGGNNVQHAISVLVRDFFEYYFLFDYDECIISIKNNDVSYCFFLFHTHIS